jgi:hypothetical protein
MITEVGSIFPLDTLEIKLSTKYTNEEFKSFLGLKDDTLFLSLAREGFSIVARNHSENKKVLLPGYTCQTVCDPFVELGWELYTYLIDDNLRINECNILEKVNCFKPNVAVFHPFYGSNFTPEEIDTIKLIKRQGVIIVIDYTQSIYYKEHLDFADYIVASLRKWFDCPDGGYIYSNNHNLSAYLNLQENISFIVPQTDSMYLRGDYFKTGNQHLKDISIRLNKQAVGGAEKNIQPHSLSTFSFNRLLNSSIEEFGNIRFDNYSFLHNNLIQNKKIRFVYGNLSEVISAPLYFPLFCKNRSELQKQLAQNKVYAPILWEIPEYYSDLDDCSKYIYEHILVIPIDQRYGIREMKRICDIINAFSKEEN